MSRTASATKTTKAPSNGQLAEKAVKKNGKIDWDHVDTEIEYAGTKITLPGDPARMSIDAALKALERKKKDEETELDTHEIVDAFPLDGAVAFTKALRRKYGWANSVPTPGFFGPTPPKMLTVVTGPDEADSVQVPWGGFQIPGIDNPIHTSATDTARGSAFVIYGKVKKREAYILKELAELTRQIVAAELIYRGKAIRLVADGDLTDFESPPQFIDTRPIKPEELVLSRDVEEQVAINLWTLIEKTGECLAANIPLKRGILLEGPYGAGKTLVSAITAKRCVDHSWTYILLDRASALSDALEFAKRYEPCVIFAEDIDRTTGERNEQANDLLNILDGVLSKNAKIMVVLTTNHVERINQAMLRPGRLDAVISVLPPDAEAVERLLRVYGGALIEAGESLGAVATQLEGQIPATIREVVERAKLATVRRGGETVNQDDLLAATRFMQNHLRLLNRPSNVVVTPEERVGLGMADIVDAKIAHAVSHGIAALAAVIGRGIPAMTTRHTEESGAANLLALVSKPSGLSEIKKIANGKGEAVGNRQ